MKFSPGCFFFFLFAFHNRTKNKHIYFIYVQFKVISKGVNIEICYLTFSLSLHIDNSLTFLFQRKEVLEFLHRFDNGRYAHNLIVREREKMDVKYIK